MKYPCCDAKIVMSQVDTARMFGISQSKVFIFLCRNGLQDPRGTTKEGMDLLKDTFPVKNNQRVKK